MTTATERAANDAEQESREKVESKTSSQGIKYGSTRDLEKGLQTRQHLTVDVTSRFRGSPLAIIALLDLANSSDFAANVFNEIPVPTYAAALMIVGGLFALFMTVVAFWDGYRSWRNIRLLLQERRQLRACPEKDRTRGHHALMRMNTRDLGTELFERLGLETAMGFSALMVAVGTLMAPAGANRRIYEASNLLSGYIGNSPTAAYGFVNIAWSIHAWRRCALQRSLAGKHIPSGVISDNFLRRLSVIQRHAFVNGATCLVSGALGLLTPTRWWPYPILLVLNLLFIYTVLVFRYRISYDRRLFLEDTIPDLSIRSISEDIAFVIAVTDMRRSADMPVMLSSEAAVHLLARCDLFSAYCDLLRKRKADVRHATVLLEDSMKFHIDLNTSNAENEQAALQSNIHELLKHDHHNHLLRKRASCLLELLGSFLIGMYD